MKKIIFFMLFLSSGFYLSQNFCGFDRRHKQQENQHPEVKERGLKADRFIQSLSSHMILSELSENNRGGQIESLKYLSLFIL